MRWLVSKCPLKNRRSVLRKQDRIRDGQDWGEQSAKDHITGRQAYGTFCCGRKAATCVVGDAREQRAQTGTWKRRPRCTGTGNYHQSSVCKNHLKTDSAKKTVSDVVTRNIYLSVHFFDSFPLWYCLNVIVNIFIVMGWFKGTKYTTFT